MSEVVGVLALQGAYQKHVDSLSKLAVESRLIRKTSELDDCTALIIPGGESTTISLLMQEYDMHNPIKKFAETYPVMGVCAGMIMMSDKVDDDRVIPLGILPFKALRNHFGRQLHSFSADIKLEFDRHGEPFSAQFIRAPGIEELSPEIKVLASYHNEAIMIGGGKHVALSFHPELTADTRIHDYWLSNF